MNARGSTWNKWDLHVHTPDSLVNNYKSNGTDDVWESYIKDFPVPKVTDAQLSTFGERVCPLFYTMENNEQEISKLNQLKQLVVSHIARG